RDRDQLCQEHLRAKRARVESIIRGMNLPASPPTRDSSGERGGGQDAERGSETLWEDKRKPRLPQQQQGDAGLRQAGAWSSSRAESCQRLQEQLLDLEQQLWQLQEKFFQVCTPGDAVHMQEGMQRAHLAHGEPGGGPGRDSAAVASDLLWRSVPEATGHKVPQEEEEEDVGNMSGLPAEATVLLEMLKHELAGATARVVDSLLKTRWPKAGGHPRQWHRSLPVPAEGARREHFASGRCRKPPPQPPPGDVLNSLRAAQAEALSGASQKSPDAQPGPVCSRGVGKPCQVAGKGCPLGTTGPVQDSQLLSQLLGCGQHGPWGGSARGSPSAAERGPPERLDLPWGAIKPRAPGARQQQDPLPPGAGGTGSLALLPAARAAHTQEALTPGHLKKAKLMFFFTRYPSSTLLKSYFLDVQFSRCITSQLIKWFSNFREFFYIQVEKFARQALLEGIADAKALRVSRDSELFRALNTHYNKGNDFEVPKRFLDVASLTLQEFFSAVRAGKDSDPSWKKPIYKIISKLDSDIPAAFKSSGSSQELLRS
ncbi:PROX2 protein, partial [Eudromia elegans]|nr:PROX2 protein [Eudromia elegans]